jgi:hypothetical protein
MCDDKVDEKRTEIVYGLTEKMNEFVMRECAEHNHSDFVVYAATRLLVAWQQNIIGAKKTKEYDKHITIFNWDEKGSA